MIVYAEREYRDEEIFEVLRPYVREWFKRKFGSFTPPQRYAIMEIKRKRNVLICSPTGTGKTLAAFLAILDELFSLGERGELEDGVYCVYVSPLRALNNDIKRNLEEPLREIREIAEEMGVNLPEIRVDVRTGDTPTSRRQRQLRKPPHILITTPETLAIVLSAPKFRERLRSVRYAIVDEIHELSSSKRGVHLSLSLERLRELCGRNFVRIGLSATQAPLEEIAKFLVGYENGRDRGCVIVDVSYTKKLDLRVLCPVDNIVDASASEISDAIYKLLDKLISEHRTTLVFTNTRSGTERVVYHLRKMFGDKYVDNISAHHSSLSRNIRLEVEERLKRGELKAVVCSTSLELGIDIGYIDLVVQIGSPKSVSRALQRVGRAGHRLHDVSKGRIIVVDRDDLVECSVMVKCAYEGMIDRVRIPKNCLDVLAQHIMGMSLERKWGVREAYDVITRSYCYRDLDFETFLDLLRYLAGYHAELRDRKVYGKIWLDEGEMVFGRRGKYARVIYSENIGTIPDEVSVDVFTLDGRYIGTIEEEFLERLLPGDIFVLGGRTYEFVKARGLRAYVRPAEGQKPTVPAWFSEMLPLSFDLAMRINEFRKKIKEMLDSGARRNEIVQYLMREYYLDEKSANSIYDYFLEQYLYTDGIIPNHEEILVEKFRDEMGRICLVFHTLFGRRTNDALSRAYAYRLSQRLRCNVGIAVTDNGFMLILPRDKDVDPEMLDGLIKSNELEEILKRAIERTELFKRRFRHCASRGLLVLRSYKGHKISVSKQQLTSQSLLRAIKRIGENFPILKETYREILEDVMDIHSAREVLRWIESGRSKLIFRDSGTLPSPFAHGIVLAGEADVVLMEDRREFLRRLHERILKAIEEARGEGAIEDTW